MNNLILSFGSNKGKSLYIFKKAELLVEIYVGKIINTSSIYKTEPWGNKKQQDFLNKVLLITTDLEPYVVLKNILNIENTLGRTRREKWAARTIDIDILFYNDEIINTDILKVPHPYIEDRNFILAPMAEIDRSFIHPVSKKNIEVLLNDCEDVCKIERIYE